MITNLSQKQLVLLGQNVSARRMIDQARYTLGRVSVDPSMKSRLGDDFLAEAHAAVESLEAALRQRFDARAAALRATKEQAVLVEKAGWYRKALVREMASARLRGVAVSPQAAESGGYTTNPTVLAVDLERLLSLAVPEASALGTLGVTQAFLDEGKDLVARLRASEERQELAKRTFQKSAVARKRELAAVVFIAVRAIIDASVTVHRGDPVAAAEYTFDVLYGTSRAPSEAPPPSPADSPPASAA